MTPQRRRQPLQSEKMDCSPLQGTRNRRRSEILLRHTRSNLRPADLATSRIKDLRSRRVFSSPSFATGAVKEDILDSKNGGILRSSEIECTPPHGDGVSERECDGSVSLGKTKCGDEAVKAEIGLDLDVVSGEKVDRVQNSRLKLYWNSNSHCYRRLLPFLKDIAKDNAGTLEIRPCQNRSLKVDKFSREGFVGSVDTSPGQQEAKVIDSLQDKRPLDSQFTLQDSEKEDILNFYTGSAQDTGEIAGEIVMDPCIILEDSIRNIQDTGVRAENKSMILEHSTSESEDIGATMTNSSMVLEGSVSNGQDTRVTPMDSCNSTSDILPASLICDHNLLCKPGCSSSITREYLCILELSGCTSQPHRTFPKNTREDQDVTASISEVVEEHYLTSPKSEILSPIRCSTIAPVKGILKRQRRGCRGACTCLECGSFLLNAEKAFEFSKKQLLDAEGVALGLMKELSFLRKMVVDSTSPVFGPEGRSVLKHNQVQEICRRSSRAEQLARFHLKKMTSDLEINCRTTNSPHSRVTFAESVEERIFTE